MSAIKSMADGRMYDDRNDYDRSLKAQGLRIFEDGEKPSAPKPPSTRQIIEREMQKYV
jgi:hypothetical protein